MFDIKETCIYKGLVEYILDKKVRIFTKDTYSCYRAKDIVNGELFKDWLKENKVKEIDICGVETMCCVLASAFDLFDAGYKINVLNELCADMNGKYDKVSKEIIKNNFK